MDFASCAIAAPRRKTNSCDGRRRAPASASSRTDTKGARPVLLTFGCSSSKGFSLMTIDKPSKVFAIARASRRYYPRFIESYCTLDPRSLGIGRIGLGALLLYDLARRVPGLATWYSNDGLLPNHTVLWRPSSDYVFSFLLAASRPGE